MITTHHHHMSMDDCCEDQFEFFRAIKPQLLTHYRQSLEDKWAETYTSQSSLLFLSTNSVKKICTQMKQFRRQIVFVCVRARTHTQTRKSQSIRSTMLRLYWAYRLGGKQHCRTLHEGVQLLLTLGQMLIPQATDQNQCIQYKYTDT